MLAKTIYNALLMGSTFIFFRYLKALFSFSVGVI